MHFCTAFLLNNCASAHRHIIRCTPAAVSLRNRNLSNLIEN
nr:MAG TPA: hypothetical protein [Bacteriophage sp.]